MSRPVRPLVAGAVLATLAALAGCEEPPPVTPTTPQAPATTPATPPPAATPPGAALASVDEAALDPSAAPCTDLYQYACGGWLKATPIPEDRPAWSRSFDTIMERNETELRA